MTQAIELVNFEDSDWDEPNAVEEYRALVRSLRRKRGFGLFFVQASVAKGQEILADVRRDLPGKRVVEVTLNRTDERLFEQLEAVWEREKVDVFWIEGLAKSLLGYEDIQWLAGWDEQDLITYSWKGVPPILAHVNLGRERFESRFDCAIVFVVPLFVVKYLLRRAGDFFDWKSGFFEFPDNRQESSNQMLKDADYEAYLRLDYVERTQKILQLKDLLDEPQIEVDQQAKLLREIGRLFESGKEYEQAIISYDRAIALKSDFGGAWIDRGDALRSLGRYEEAITAYQRAIELNPEDADAYNNLGGTYYNQKQYEEAITACQRVIELNPEDANAYNNLGITYKDQKRYEEAIIAYNRAIYLNPEYAKAFANRGEAYRLLKRYEEALRDFDRAIELDDSHSWAIASRGETYQSLERYEEALKDFSRAIELDSEWAWAIASRGENYRLMKRYEEALKDLDRAIELNNKYIWAIENRGKIYLQLNQTEKAIEDFDLAIKLDSDDWYFYLRAIAYLKLNQPKPAETDFQQAISIAQSTHTKDPTDYRNTFNLALYHLAAAHPEESDRLYTSNLTAPIENLEEAITDLDDFLHLFPDHTQAQQVKQMLQRTIDAAQPITL